MTITRHEYTATIVGTSTRLEPTSGFVAFDETWSPYVTAEIVVPLVTPQVRALLDPRTGARVRLTAAARFGTPAPVSDVTADVGGDLELINDLWSGRTLRDLSADYSTPYNIFGLRDSQVLNADLAVRRVTDDPLDGTTTITLASDEALAQDAALVAQAPTTVGATTARAAVTFALATIGATLEPGSANGTISADSTVWEPGVNVWDYLTPLVEATGLRLWCDERRRWHLTVPLTPGNTVFAATAATIIDDQHTLDTQEDYADAVVIRYTWLNAAGETQVAYDAAGSTSARRVMRLDRARPIPAVGAAAYLRERTIRRGLAKTLTQVSNYTVRPGHTVVASGDQGIFYGLASLVEFNLTEDQMRVRTRELTEASAYSWGVQPPGHRWQDVPAGTDWTEYEPPEV